MWDTLEFCQHQHFFTRNQYILPYPEMELRFQHGALILKSSFDSDFKMELRLKNRALISKSSFDFEMELLLQNRASISKWSFEFKIKLPFWNIASITKWSFDFKIEKSNFSFKIEVFDNMCGCGHMKKCKLNHSRELNRRNMALRDSRELNRRNIALRDILWHVAKEYLLAIYNMCC